MTNTKVEATAAASQITDPVLIEFLEKVREWRSGNYLHKAVTSFLRKQVETRGPLGDAQIGLALIQIYGKRIVGQVRDIYAGDRLLKLSYDYISSLPVGKASDMPALLLGELKDTIEAARIFPFRFDQCVELAMREDTEMLGLRLMSNGCRVGEEFTRAAIDFAKHHATGDQSYGKWNRRYGAALILLDQALSVNDVLAQDLARFAGEVIANDRYSQVRYGVMNYSFRLLSKFVEGKRDYATIGDLICSFAEKAVRTDRDGTVRQEAVKNLGAVCAADYPDLSAQTVKKCRATLDGLVKDRDQHVAQTARRLLRRCEGPERQMQLGKTILVDLAAFAKRLSPT